MKSRLLKIVRNVTISIVVLLVLIVGGGVAYTWYVGQDESSVTIAPSVETPAPSLTTRKPPKISPNAPVSASVQSLTSPVAPGANASLTVKTNPGSRCTVEVIYDEVPSTDSGLKAKTADDYGMVEWAWTVEETVPLGSWPVKASCSSNKKSAMVQGDLEVALKKK